MSYNYDYNPWDDNYSSSNANQSAGGGYGSQPASTGYTASSNVAGGQYATSPATNYDQQYDYNTGAQQYDAPAGDIGPGAADQGPNKDGSQEQQQQQQQQPSFVGRFLRQHVPLCGPILDLLGSINLPFIDALLQHINRDLLVSKVFYFFFYSAFGSLFPLMGVYFKQLGMNPSQVGILTGVRPFIEIFSAPFWNSLANRFQKSKALLLFSLLSWIVFTYSLAHIRPPASACVAFNDTDYVLYTPYSANDLSNYDINQSESPESSESMSVSSNNNSKSSSNIISAGEKKDQILANEENQNDQGRRRRRRRKRKRRQADVTGRFDVDSEQDPFSEGISADSIPLQIDLENDFDDTPIGSVTGNRMSSSTGSNNEHEDHVANDDDEDEDESIDSLGALTDHPRRRLHLLRRKRSHSLLSDYQSAEGDESEQNEETGGDNGDDTSKGKDSESGNGNYDNGGTTNEEEVNSSGGSNNNNNNNDYTDNSSDESSGSNGEKHGRQQSGREPEDENENDTETEVEPESATKATATTATTVTTTMTTTGRAGASQEQQAAASATKQKRIFKQRHKTPPTHIVGMSPITVEYAVNYNKDKHSKFVTPMFSTIVYNLDEIKEVFFLLLLLISLGEFFSAPAITLADSATLSYLGDNVDLYGRQRMFGSFSWAITLLLVGMALDNATSIADHPCGPHQRERSYTVCFVIFSLLMACALMTATQFRFSYPKKVANGGQAMAITTDGANGANSTVKTTLADGSPGNIDQLYTATQPRSIFNTAPPVNAPPPSAQTGADGGSGAGREKFEFLDKWKSAVFAQRTRELPEWVNVFRQFQNSLHLMYLFITWFLGCGVGLVFTFLFWHLQDVGGTPTLFGICSVINHISEIMAYFFSSSVIKRVGHTRVLSVGLGCNVIRFIYVAFLSNPYYALPFELVQGITHAACFAACCSYMSHVSKPELRTSTQGVMQGLHHGIGRACGALIGGYAINTIGSRASFCIYGLLSGLVLGGFLYIRKRYLSLSLMNGGQDGSVIVEPDVKMVDQSEAALGGFGAPQGVPSALPNRTAATIGFGVGVGGSTTGAMGGQAQC